MTTSVARARWGVPMMAGIAVVTAISATSAGDAAAQVAAPSPSAPPVYGGGRGNAPGGLPDIPPPPRMLEPGTASAEGDGRPATSQREYCLGLMQRIEALPAAAPDRSRVEETYRKECAHAAR